MQRRSHSKSDKCNPVLQGDQAELKLALRFFEHPNRMLSERQATAFRHLRDDDAGFFALEFRGLRELAAKEFDEAA